MTTRHFTNLHEALAAWALADEESQARMHPVLRARMKAKGLEHPLPALPLPVIMMDDIVHTGHYPCCNHPGCICYGDQREMMIADEAARKQARRSRRVSRTIVARSYEEQKLDAIQAALNGNRGFSLPSRER